MPDTPSESQLLHASTRDLRRRLAITLERTADVFERSAQLADQDADRRARHGQPDAHATERHHARNARHAAARARTTAAHLTRPAEPDYSDLDILIPPGPARSPDA